MHITDNQAAERQAEHANGSVSAAITLARAARVIEALLENAAFDGSTVLLQFKNSGQAFEIVREAREAIKAARHILTGVKPC